jgi:hypothetical protein
MVHLHPAGKHALLGLCAQWQASIAKFKPRGTVEIAMRYRTEALLHYNKGMQAFANHGGGQLPMELYVSCGILLPESSSGRKRTWQPMCTYCTL